MRSSPFANRAKISKMHSLGYTAVAVLLKYFSHAQALGLDCQAALRAAGLDNHLLSDNSRRISGEQHERLLLNLLEQSGDPLFGLHAARYVQPGSWSVLGYITMNCATLGQAMARILPYEKLVGDMGTSHIATHDTQVQLSWQCHYPNSPVRRQLIENVLASWLHYARWIADMHYSPQQVWLEHARPADCRQAEYEKHFGCPVLFEQPCNALLIPQDYLQLPLRQADASLLRTLEQHASGLLARLDEQQPLPQRVRNLLRQMLGEGLPRKERVAEQLHMTLRTLQRHLQQAGTSYQEILDQLRRELAEHYLQHSELPIQDIAAYLGFSETRSFHRSFKQWTGCTPGQYREQHKATSGLGG